MHDNLDWIEVYPQGTSINGVASTPPPQKKTHEKHQKKRKKDQAISFYEH